MGKVGKILRRTFLIGSAAIVGGVAFGAYYVTRPAANPLKPGEGEAALNPFVLIDQNGVTLFAPRAEMGQGVKTTWAALIAEELDVDLDQITVLHGPAAAAYYNSALVGEGLPNKGYDISNFQHNLGEALGVLGKTLSLQVTGGSTSMKDGFERMRQAGASARETLKRAAADRLGVDPSELQTASGHVIAPNGDKIAYSELAEDAAGLEPVEVSLRDPSEWRYLGRTQPRLDMVGKVTGTAEFGVDVRLPGMKFAAVRMNPKLGGAMNGFDDSTAKSMPGVEKIVDLGTGVAVIANNTWLANQAVEAIDVDWGDAPYPPDTDGIFAKIAEAFDDAPNSTMRDDGDVSVTPEGATEVTAEYQVPYLAHATMEPMNATALYTGNAVELWCGNQAPTLIQFRVANTANLDTEAVQIHTTYLGGGFGRRGELDFSEIATKVAMAMPGTPVQTTWSREEDMRHDFYRPGAIARMRGAVQDGKAVLIDGKVSSQSPTQQAVERYTGFPGGGPDKVLVEGFFNQPYAVPNYRMSGHIADLAVPVGFWRSVGNSHNGFFHETFMDEMAHAAGRDPLEFRLELMKSEHAPSAGCLEAVKEMSGWTGKTPDGVGRGVAFTYSFGTPVAQVIEVADEDGTIRINKAWIACDMGLALDPDNVKAQMFGGMIYGLSAACYGEITFADGEAEQFNFPDYDAMRMHTTPQVEVRVLETNRHMGGAGEPGTPPSMPALGNALFDLTGERARSLPLINQFNLLV
ncbi:MULTISPECIES: xanthine dehydrogenase family protein molybdopterin-binding subunit [unclassified Ruegeria]|uniref:xanthine dehydrogenase family protein molybdopterin-binding subunit n=1 Tax=unclassified Ruegeria TaxID=2625375 RepID=UPI001490E62C|nr:MULTISPECIES: molybdopterin cofactor-binding domain-containing protein [unclassified Ruegeria]NOD86731.1 molybdopterin-dependent oxidoreductase [Ruegeria sp. HKCCD4318]NOE12286.1 molybdopterin-dependent oxidoreductase [Ruegeria sp. HKCCD4318-2]NOG09549.1 xanthine dehydrogenase family protein molybdopterin-binding subunit [Ruegeria sp. HKCCD4315]